MRRKNDYTNENAKLQKAKNTFWTVLLTILIIFYAINLYGYFVDGKMNIFGYKVMYIPTDSMEPTIKKHSFAIGQIIDADEVEIGDIICYKHKSKPYLIVHRVVSISDEGFTFKGDNNHYPDDYMVTNDEIKYKLVKYVSST